MRRAIICILAVLAAPSLLHARQQPGEGWVVLTLDEYRTLRSRAFPPPADPAPPPVDAATTRVEYDLRAGADTVSGEARLTIDVFKEGWVSIPLPAGVLVRGARMDGRPTTVVDGAPPHVLIAKTGRSTLALDVVVPVTASAGAETLTLPPSASAVSLVTLVVPREGIDLAVGGGFVGSQTSTAGESRWVVHGSPSQALTMTWKRRADDRRATLPLRMRARVTELVSLGEEASTVTVGARVEVVQGLAREVVLTTPEGVAVNDVSGAAVAGWRHEAGQLTVSFLEPIASEAAFRVNAEIRTPRDGAMAIPLLRVPAADRETGGIAVDVAGTGEIEGTQPRGMEVADTSEIGDVVAGRESPSMMAFRFMPLAGSAPRSLSVTVSRYSPEAVLVANVEEARYDAVVGEDGKMLVRGRYAVRNNQRSFLAVVLPEGATLWSARLAGRPVQPGVATNGHLLLPLQKGRASEDAPVFAVEVVYLQRAAAWREKGIAAIDLPALDLPVSRTGFCVRHSPRFSVEVRPGTFRPDRDTGPWSPALFETVPVGGFGSGRGAAGGTASGGGAGGGAPPPAPEPDAGAEQFRANFLDRYRFEAGRTAGGIVPITVPVPEFGAPVFMAAELTAESRAPRVELEYRRIER